MNTKVIDKLSNADYHSSPAISKSGLDMINKSPLHYWNRYLRDDKPAFTQTDALRFGSLLHNQVLEPDVFDDEFLVMPDDINRRTKEGRERYAELMASKKIVVSSEDLNTCKKITSAISQHKTASRYLATAGKSELSLFWNMEGVDCRCRPDFITEDGYIVDLKTTLTASQRGFSRKAIYDYRYHVQAAFYTEGYKACFGELPKGFVFIACEKTEPFSIGVFSTPPDTFELGHTQMMSNLVTYRHCLENNVWPSYNGDKEMELRV